MLQLLPDAEQGCHYQSRVFCTCIAVLTRLCRVSFSFLPIGGGGRVKMRLYDGKTCGKVGGSRGMVPRNFDFGPFIRHTH